MVADELALVPSQRVQPPRVWVVACCFVFTAQQLRAALVRLAERLGVHFCGVVVDNQLRELPSDDEDWAFILGSNRDHDFSAYVEGLRHGQSTLAADVVLFLNDSLFTNRGAYVNAREVLSYRDLLRQLQVPSMCGRTDRYSTLCFRNPWSQLPIYVPSYCFLLNRQAFAVLLQLPKHAEDDGLQPNLAVSDVAWGQRLPANFREFIRAFVQYRHPAFAWPGWQRYAVDERLVAIKARCIYFEHRLSGEIAREGCLVATNARLLPRCQIYLAEKWAVWGHRIAVGRWMRGQK